MSTRVCSTRAKDTGRYTAGTSARVNNPCATDMGKQGELDLFQYLHIGIGPAIVHRCSQLLASLENSSAKLWTRAQLSQKKPTIAFVGYWQTDDIRTFYDLGYLQEGQHPLTGQRACNFRLLANQWAERRLVTQWRHCCWPMRQSVCNAWRCFQCGSVPLRSDIKGTELPPASILIPLERQLSALQLCRWQFLYNETLQQTFRPLLLKLSKRRQI